MAQALADKQITLAFQPIVDLSTGRLDTLEALARWAPGGRPVSPEVFVRVAESCNLIDSLFRFVLGEACAQLARWTALPGGSDVRVAVNVSPGQLSSPELPLFIAAELARQGLAGDRLVLEITETGGSDGHRNQPAVCHELRRLGVRLSVDDFGTGLSSLARLRDLPIDEVKIDRSFISNLDVDDARRRFVWGVLAFAERVGLTVVAEGVEREAERDALTELGCHRAQGFLFSRPVPAESVDALLRSPGSWLPGILALTEPHAGKVRQRARDRRGQSRLSGHPTPQRCAAEAESTRAPAAVIPFGPQMKSKGFRRVVWGSMPASRSPVSAKVEIQGDRPGRIRGEVAGSRDRLSSPVPEIMVSEALADPCSNIPTCRSPRLPFAGATGGEGEAGLVLAGPGPWLTVDILAAIPVDELELRLRMLRPGRSVELVEAALSAGGRLILLPHERDHAGRGGPQWADTPHSRPSRSREQLLPFDPSDNSTNAVHFSLGGQPHEAGPGIGNASATPLEAVVAYRLGNTCVCSI